MVHRSISIFLTSQISDTVLAIMRCFIRLLEKQAFHQGFSAARSECRMSYCLYHYEDCSIISITFTSQNGKETEHDRIEETKAHGQGVLVDDSRDDEHREHGSCSKFPFWQLQGSKKEQEGSLDQSSGVSSAGNLYHKMCRVTTVRTLWKHRQTPHGCYTVVYKRFVL